METVRTTIAVGRVSDSQAVVQTALETVQEDVAAVPTPIALSICTYTSSAR